MEIVTIPVGQLQTNCYLVWGENTDKCVVIDPGDDAGRIMQKLESLGKTVEAVLLTHGHFDHVGAVRQVMEAFSCPVYICPEDLKLPLSMTAGEIPYTHACKEGDCLFLAGLEIAVLQTPGHTPGSVCYQAEDVLFTGDTLFAGSCGRVDFPGSSAQQMICSLQRLKALPGDFRVLPGHAEETSLSEERRSNPFM